MTKLSADFRHLPADVRVEDTVAFQLEDDRLDPEGGGASAVSVVGDDD